MRIKGYLWHLWIAALFAVPLLAQEPPIEFFYSPDCLHCSTIETEVLPELVKKYELKINYWDVETPSGYNHLVEMEDRYGVYVEGFPAILAGNRLLVGEKEITEWAREQPDTQVSRQPGDTSLKLTNQQTDHLTPIIAYFYNPGCKECSRVEYTLKYIKNQIPNIKIERFDVSKRDNKELLEATCEKYNVPSNLMLITPAIFLGDTFFIKNIRDNEILTILNTKVFRDAPWEGIQAEEKAKKSIILRFKSFTPAVIIGAGLLDGVNPCAFATIIFFVSYLTLAAYKKKEILGVGISFTIAVFIAYLLMGMGLAEFITAIRGFAVISQVLYYAIAGMVFILGILSLRDYYLYKEGKTKEMKLQLPDYLKKLIHKVIRKEIGEHMYDDKKTRRQGERGLLVLISTAFGAGFIISLVEVVCTGQVYLPTIAYILGVPELRIKALFYLIVYNVFFILPLIFVFGLSYFGTSSKVLANFMHHRLGSIKIGLGCLFFGLGGFLLAIAPKVHEISSNKIRVPTNITKIDLYTMSQNPEGILLENIIGGLQKRGLNVKLSVYFTDIVEEKGEFYSTYMRTGVEEAKRQVLIQVRFPEKFIPYLLLRNKDPYSENWRDVVTEVGINPEIVNTAEQKEFRKNVRKAGLMAKEPNTLYINDKRYTGKLTSYSMLRFICDQNPGLKVCKTLPECVSDDDCKRKGSIGICLNPGTREASCKFKPAIRVELTILTDSLCVECDTTHIVSYFRKFLPGLTLRTLSLSAEAQELIEKYGFSWLPVFILDKKVADAYNFKKIQDKLEKKGESYVVKNVNPGYYLLRTPKKQFISLFVMSECPYGIEAEKFLLGEWRKAHPDWQIEVHYIAEEDTESELVQSAEHPILKEVPGEIKSLHGISEVEEDIRQLCARKYYPKKYMDYILCRNNNIRSTLWEECAAGSGINADIIRKCQYREGKRLLSDNIALTDSLKIKVCPTFLLENRTKLTGLKKLKEQILQLQ